MQPRGEEVGGQHAGVAVPPVVVLDRGDARVLLDLHGRRGYREGSVSARRRRAREVDRQAEAVPLDVAAAEEMRSAARAVRADDDLALDIFLD